MSSSSDQEPAAKGITVHPDPDFQTLGRLKELLLERNMTELFEKTFKFEIFFKKFPLPLVLCPLMEEPSGCFLTINEAFTKLTGYTPEDIPTLAIWGAKAYPDFQERLAAEQDWRREMGKITGFGAVTSPMERRIVCREGNIIEVDFVVVMLVEAVLLAVIDRTAAKRAQRELISSHERERAAELQHREILQQKLQSSIVASAVAHEINQPLSQILLKAQLALENINSDGSLEDIETILRDMVEGSRRVERTIEKMRALLRNVPTELKPLLLAQVIDDAVLYMKPVLASHGVELELEIRSRQALVQGDAAQLQSALSNLIRNAVEAMTATPAGQRRLRITLSSSGNNAEVTLCDSGPGISPTLREYLFELMSSSKPGGTGIGLYLARIAVGNHLGTIGIVESPLGGAGFLITLPLSAPDP